MLAMKLNRAAEELMLYRARETSRVDSFREALQGCCDKSTNADIARTLGVTGAYVCDVLHGRRGVGEKLLRAAAKFKE